MTAVAGEVADGVLAHAFTTEAYLREVTLPALAEGASRADRAPEDAGARRRRDARRVRRRRPPDELAARILERYGDVVDRVSLYTSFAFRDGDGATFRSELADRDGPGGGPAA